MQTEPSTGDPLAKAVRLCEQVCAISGSPTMIDEVRAGLTEAGVVAAVRDHDDAVLFDWFMEALSYQGISDTVAQTYMEQHGTATAQTVESQLAASPSCPKLQTFWAFHGCRYHKGSGTCAEPEHLGGCPLPRHRLRNGRLNQTAFSLHMFIRDVIGGDLVGWIDLQLATADQHPEASTRSAAIQAALIVPLSHVHGVGDKVLNMALSDLLIAGDPGKPHWVEAGAAMIAVDSLVHNWLHRTGILQGLGYTHAYGPACYRDRGCLAVIELVSANIDARRYNASFPACFPRFVQKAMWRFCAQKQLNQCNGNTIDDRVSCKRIRCALRASCGHVPLQQLTD